MAVSNVSRGRGSNLPEDLKVAQEAIHLPEVQEMLRRLSKYNLGIYMPHMHDEQTGQFHTLSDEVVQVEKGLKVSFETRADIEAQVDDFVQIGWAWRENAVGPLGFCHTVCQKNPNDSNHYTVHKD